MALPWPEAVHGGPKREALDVLRIIIQIVINSGMGEMLYLVNRSHRARYNPKPRPGKELKPHVYHVNRC